MTKAVTHPLETLEAMAQNLNDTYEVEGLEYMRGYVIGDIVVGELSPAAVSKAVGKGAGAVDDIGNIANKADDVADIAETAGKMDDIAEIAETAGSYSGDLMSVEDAARYSEYWRELGIGSDETWDKFLKYNPNGTIDDYFDIIQNQLPWPNGYNPVEVTLNSGDTFEMALGVGQPPTMPGRFATPTGNIVDVNYVRNELAVKLDWKPDLDRVVVYQVKDNVTLRSLQGPVGPQIDLNTNTYLPGGADQINILLDRNIDAMDYMNIISINPIY